MCGDASPVPRWRVLRTRWSVLAAFVLVTTANQMLWLTFAPVTTEAAKHYGVSVGAIGALSAVFPALYVLLAIPAGFALDRWFKGAVLVGAALTALGGLLRLVGDDYTWVLVGQLVVAVAQPLVTNSVAKLAGAYTSEEDRPMAIAVCSAGLFAGLLLAFATGAAFGGGSGLHACWWCRRSTPWSVRCCSCSGCGCRRVRWSTRRRRGWLR